ncbi:MAG TPA: FAD-dependent oxidoreductase [Burkholderiales bacterium]|nr:FAD-dependent oxidoreductase [Burkholderiales bacterium]
MNDSTVIVGAGQAGAEVAAALRQRGYQGSITLIGDEAHPPYRRPPLSKAFLAGEQEVDALYLRPQAAYAAAAIDLRLGTRAAAIDRAGRRVLLDGGESVAYTRLVLATGGRARRLDVPGWDHPNVRLLRSIADVQGIRERFKPGARLAVIGGGYIGLEAAAVAVGRGMRVTVLEAAPRLLARVASEPISQRYAELHRAHGVEVRMGCGVERIGGGAETPAVDCADGGGLKADVIVAGVGLVPNTELAAAAGLDIGNGVRVDGLCRSSDPAIFACGDCAEHHNAFLGHRVRLESVQNATEQGRAVAAAICGGGQPYNPVPWFWSDQYDFKLQMVGFARDYQRVAARGSIAGRSFIIFYLRHGAVIAADAVNRPQDFLFAKQLVARGARVDPERLEDEKLPLRQLADAAREKTG